MGDIKLPKMFEHMLTGFAVGSKRREISNIVMC